MIKSVCSPSPQIHLLRTKLYTYARVRNLKNNVAAFPVNQHTQKNYEYYQYNETNGNLNASYPLIVFSKRKFNARRATEVSVCTEFLL